MRTKCPIDMKQMALEREFYKLLLHHKKLILTSAQFRLVLPWRLTFSYCLAKNMLMLLFQESSEKLPNAPLFCHTWSGIIVPLHVFLSEFGKQFLSAHLAVH